VTNGVFSKSRQPRPTKKKANYRAQKPPAVGGSRSPSKCPKRSPEGKARKQVTKARRKRRKRADFTAIASPRSVQKHPAPLPDAKKKKRRNEKLADARYAQTFPTKTRKRSADRDKVRGRVPGGTVSSSKPTRPEPVHRTQPNQTHGTRGHSHHKKSNNNSITRGNVSRHATQRGDRQVLDHLQDNTKAGRMTSEHHHSIL